MLSAATLFATTSCNPSLRELTGQNITRNESKTYTYGETLKYEISPIETGKFRITFVGHASDGMKSITASSAIAIGIGSTPEAF